MDQDNLTSSSSPSASNNGDLQGQVESLRSLVNTILVLCLVISGTLNIYFLRQYRNAKADLSAIRPQATAMVAEYEKTTGPAMDEFVKKITEYGKTHADFAPIMNKYQLNKTPATGASNPAPAAQKKK
jgi:hypothetical protein